MIFVVPQSKNEGPRKSEMIPDDGNSVVHAPGWTEKEKQSLDRFLTGWARWEVNYVEGYIRSTKCEGTTQNEGEICDACLEVSKDQALIRSVRRVSDFIMTMITFWVICTTSRKKQRQRSQLKSDID